MLVIHINVSNINKLFATQGRQCDIKLVIAWWDKVCLAHCNKHMISFSEILLVSF